MATPLPVSRFDHPEETDIVGMRGERRQNRKQTSAKAPGQFDFAFHMPTESDILNLKIVGFSLTMAVGMMLLGFTIAAGILRIF